MMRYFKGMRFALLLLPLFLITACGSDSLPTTPEVSETRNTRETQETPETPQLTQVEFSELKPVAQEFIELMNAHRVSKGCAPLIYDEALTAIAQNYSQEMSDLNFFSHNHISKDSFIEPDINNNGTNADDQHNDDFIDRMKLANITNYLITGENILAGSQGFADNAQNVLNLWLQSPGHRANIEGCYYTHHGVGMVIRASDKHNYWTHMFFTAKAS